MRPYGPGRCRAAQVSAGPMSPLRPQSLVCTRRISSSASSGTRCRRQTSRNSGPGSAFDRPRLRRREGGRVRRAGGSARRRAPQAAGAPLAGPRAGCRATPGRRRPVGDALVDRGLAPELRVGEPAPQIGEVVGGVAHPVRHYGTRALAWRVGRPDARCGEVVHPPVVAYIVERRRCVTRPAKISLRSVHQPSMWRISSMGPRSTRRSRHRGTARRRSGRSA